MWPCQLVVNGEEEDEEVELEDCIQVLELVGRLLHR